MPVGGGGWGGVTHFLCISHSVPGWYVGHTVCNFPTWRLWPLMGRWGSSRGHGHPSLQASEVGLGDTVVPMETGCCAFACVALA